MTTITSPIVKTPKIAADTSTAKLGKHGLAVVTRLREIAVIKKAARDVEDEGKALQAELASILSGSKYGTFQGVNAVTRVDSHSTKTDVATLRQAFPEAFAACVSAEPYSYYKV